MTYKQFLKELSMTRGWDNRSGHIRKFKLNLGEICPVCAVANKLVKSTKYSVDQDNAAKYLGLRKHTAKMIAQAADSTIWYGYHHKDRQINKIRKDLLKACKLV